MILAIDPGTSESGYVVFASSTPEVFESGVLPNAEMLEVVRNARYATLAIEMVASYGMAVGREVFETCVWIGRFQQAWRSPGEVKLVYRGTVKQFLCRSARAKDANIRQALLDMLGPQGTKAKPGPCYGVRSHAWAALAVAVTVAAQQEVEHAAA